MKIALGTNDRQFLDRLHRMGGASVQEICGELQVTATAVRHRLVRLQGLGFISREVVRSGRGRPHHEYHLSEAGLRELGDNYADLATVLWRVVQNIGEPEVRRDVASRVRQTLIDRYGRFVTADALDERIEQLKSTLSDQGFDVELDTSGPLTILRENNCPYHELAVSDPGICELEQSVFQEILGTDLKLTQCSRDGDHCCEFQVGSEIRS